VTEQSPLSELARDLLAYLAEHPAARDTLEGLVEWWLLERRLKIAIIEVEEAVEDLVVQGWLARSRTADGRDHFCLCPEKVAEARRLLAIG
jgi:hypothetical protein